MCNFSLYVNEVECGPIDITNINRQNNDDILLSRLIHFVRRKKKITRFQIRELTGIKDSIQSMIEYTFVQRYRLQMFGSEHLKIIKALGVDYKCFIDLYYSMCDDCRYTVLPVDFNSDVDFYIAKYIRQHPEVEKALFQ